eukprot:2099233-Amphidinium_carterae.1
MVELVKEIYGLPPGPRAWRNTFLHTCSALGFTLHPLSPCVLIWYGHRSRESSKVENKSGEPFGVLLVQVDDVLVAGQGSEWQKVLQKLRTQFTFGKWVSIKGEYLNFNGREIKQNKDGSFIVSMQQYIQTL